MVNLNVFTPGDKFTLLVSTPFANVNALVFPFKVNEIPCEEVIPVKIDLNINGAVFTVVPVTDGDVNKMVGVMQLLFVTFHVLLAWPQLVIAVKIKVLFPVARLTLELKTPLL